MEKRIIGRDLLFLFVIICIAFVPSVVFASRVNSNAQISLNVARKTLCGQTYQVKTDSSIQLRWNEVEDADCYRLQRVSSTGKIISTETISSDETECEVKDLKPSSSYYFRIYARKNGSTIAKSKRLKVNTFSKTTGYFYRKVVVDEEWPGVLITSKKATDDQINKFNNLDQKDKPAIKFNYATNEKKLYINTYVKYEGEGQHEMYEDYAYSYNTRKYELVQKSTTTYKELIKRGIMRFWEIDIKGNLYDFAPGVNFSTKVNLIETDEPNQNYLTIYIGAKGKQYQWENIYWFVSYANIIPLSTKIVEYNYRSEYFPLTIVMPTQKQVASNVTNSSIYDNSPDNVINVPRNGPLKDSISYERMAAHEFGHVLGLDDAYNNSYRKGIRKNNEICSVDKIGWKTYDLMASYNAASASPNNIEMALIAQGMAIRGEKSSWQAFTNYASPEGYIYVKSKAIRL